MEASDHVRLIGLGSTRHIDCQHQHNEGILYSSFTYILFMSLTIIAFFVFDSKYGDALWRCAALFGFELEGVYSHGTASFTTWQSVTFVQASCLTALYSHYLEIVLEKLEELPELAGLVIALPGFLFWCLFVFRYLRLIVHLISFWLFYRPTPVPDHPTLRPQDCSIILPTVDPENADFNECIESCLSNNPGEIIIVTVGRNLAALTNQIVGPYRTAYPNTHIQVHFTAVANKRIQVAHGVGFAQGKVTILLDDHVFWRSTNFLPTILAPFENDKVGAVGTNKRVRRTDTGFNMRSFWNMIGALYLERHNFEIRATNAIDGGVFVISGRTAAYRTDILKQPGFMAAFTNERFFLGMFGPLNADDDNFLTRQVVRQGYDIQIQYSQDALIETTLGTYPKFLSQCLRWVRTTWRSNSASLFTDRTVWTRQPWCVHAVYLTSFVNFALFYDAALIYTLSAFADRAAVYKLIAWIFATKMVKLTPYFLREPQDLLMLPGYFVFAYFHSLIKLYAGLTFWVTAWGGRNLDAINQDNAHDNADGPESGAGDSQDHQQISSGSLTSQPDSSSSSSSSGSSTPRPPHSQGRVAVPGPQGWVQTPWGFVKDYNRAATPANVAESQLVAPMQSPTSYRNYMPGTPASFTFYRSSQSPASSVNSNTSSPSRPSPAGSPTHVNYDVDNGASPSPPAVRPALLTPPSTVRGATAPMPIIPSSACPSHSSHSSSRPATPTPYNNIFSPFFPSHSRSGSSSSSISSPPSCMASSTWLLSAPSLPPPIAPPAPPTPVTPHRHSYAPPINSSSSSKPLPNSHPFTLMRERRSLGIPDDYSKTWIRGKQCQCLHSDGDKLFKTRTCRCLVDDLFVVGQTIVPGQPRF